MKYPKLFLIFILIFCFFPVAHSDEKGQAEYTFGVVPQFDARKIYAIWRPILDSIERNTGLKFRLELTSNIPTFEKQFLDGKYDFAYMNPYHLIKAYDKQGYIPLLRDISTNLYGIVVVRKDSKIKNVSELDGQSVAFPSVNALGASLMVRLLLLDKYHVKIKPLYVQTHNSVYYHVILGKVMAGGGVQKTLNQQTKNVKDDLKVIFKTPEVAAHPIVANPKLPVSVKDSVVKAFLKIGQTEEGQRLLKRIPINTIGNAYLEDYYPLKNMGIERFYVNE